MTQPLILIVEDDPSSRELAQTIFEMAGYAVLSAEDGVGLAQRVTAERPDLIVMDLQLPDIDGLTLICDLKAHDKTRHVPIVVTTAFANPELYMKAFEAGCAAYLVKPLDARALLYSVADALKRREGDHDDT